MRSHFCAGTQIASRHDPLTRQLPPEIICDIFGFTLPSTTAAGCASVNAAAMKLGAVCRIWRMIAWSAPQLWSRLYIFIDLVELVKNTTRLELVQDWLSRSGQLPLSLQILVVTGSTPRQISSELVSFEPFVSLINGYSTRWREFDVTCPDWFLTYLSWEPHGSPMLQRLRIYSIYDPWNASYPSFDLGPDKPAPTDITVIGCSFNDLHIQWDNATRVDIEGISLLGCFQILKQAPNLTDASFSRVLVMNSMDIIQIMQSIEGDIVLPNLKRLHMDFQSSILQETMDIFFSSLILPALTQFEVGLVSLAKHLNPLINLIRRSACQITSLSLTRRYSRDEEHDHVVSLLRETPKLKHLQVVVKYGRGQPHPQARLLQLLARRHQLSTDDGAFLPDLVSLHCGVGRLGGRPFTWEDVPYFFNDSSETSRQLKNLRISWIREEAPPYWEKETVLRLLKHRGKGINLDARDTKGDIDLFKLSIEHHGVHDVSHDCA